MNYNITQAQFGVRPPVTKPSPRFLEVLQEDGLRQLVSNHYDILRTSQIKDMFPQDDEAFALAKQHSADFFIQICGGPDYFNQNRGAPMMVGRHQPFKITPKARLVWLDSYKQVLENLELEDELKQSFWNYIDVFSIWMINTPQD
ncbi:globin domain-containing protein [Aliarcobacter vitoriensis]|uniref:Globin n=1 Tax=Aliarcobacter vitoriensis TaxID=2011099 RepID=A0A366MTT5_9BACT|nr:globin [Aliarcobacter vitoriensis]RBQ29004.1 globin [Aliarcobacter vitoriensis]RBQ31156.1 globin [Arcobacter sp. FW59]